jgi:hypothetical protein
MSSRIRRTVLGLSMALVLALVGVILLSAMRAHATTPGESKNLEGTWRADVTPRDCNTGVEFPALGFKALVTFAKGGTTNATVTARLPVPDTRESNHYGVWQHVNDHTYSGVSESFIFNSAGVWLGTQRVTRTIEIGEDPDTFKVTAKGVFLAPDGVSPLPGFPLMVCSTGVGHRLE